ncbi:spore germination protein [Bacillus spizizenii]|uniref:Putative spore germination protein n=1 Tax=Bacillus spizizenii (strain ATCC 23059 / NRRL B-14472 / W23) TaxID=655816 RepID=E0TVJ9_BACSH|nr:spore germination protein [Bacillus spizizenii]QCJ16124.1 spore germination protein [Bacillus subtilis]ADM36845.1 putative spore germination protein [Bacillus spizizenii str. W23]AJW86261.1 membrane protein [Bacillus spizizenii]EFG91832.1 putative spore germination protein [Bacillus spizizenii ATCC 6633 = JCM 2499]KFK79760.1 GerA spore germination family protein [Bacillus spizizenii]
MNKRDEALQLIKELEDNQDRPISPDLKENLDTLTLLTEGCSDIVFRHFDFGNGLCGFIVYIEGIVKSEHIQDHALLPFLRHLTDQIEEYEEALQNTLSISSVASETSVSKVAASIIEGNAVLFADRHSKCLILKIKGGQRRSIEEPITESTIRGSREGFTESLRVNTALVRFRIKTLQLKMISFKIGTKTKTDIVLAYIDGIADPKVIDKVKKRIKKIKIDAVLESGYIEEFIEDDTYSPFPQLQYTERPDTVAAQLLEGRFAIFTDNTPFVLTGPITFWQLMQASEDYYERYLMSNLIRWLRYMFLFFALYLPAIYVAVITYHQDLMPTNLMFSVASAREPIPFPAIVEALIMEISFEALREAGVRLPKTIGQTVSILGALVIGTAAVEAGIVSAPMVIIVSLTGIASFTIPRFNLAISIRMLRFPLMILASIFGIFGIMLGTIILVLHLCKLQSFGVPYLSGISPFKRDEVKDIFVRAPWWTMTRRPGTYSRSNGQKGAKREDPQDEENNI